MGNAYDYSAILNQDMPSTKSADMHYWAFMVVTVKDRGKEIPLKMDIYAPDDIDSGIFKDVLSRMATLLYKELNADVSLQQPILITQKER